jgi:hypothetical protein
MLKLTTENLHTLRAAAAPLDPRDRGRYLEAVAEAMRAPGKHQSSKIENSLVHPGTLLHSSFPATSLVVI